MRHPHRISWRLAAAILAGVVLAALDGQAQTSVVDLLAKLPAQNPQELASINAAFLQIGPQVVKDLCVMLVPPGTGDDSPVRFALSGLANHVSNGGASDRMLVTGGVIEALGTASDPDVKAFLICLLQIAAKDEAVNTLRSFLSDERLCDPAARALVSIASPAAQSALAGALRSARGPNRVALIQAVGEVRAQEAVSTLINDASDKNATVRRAAIEALANIGDSLAYPALMRAAETTASPTDRAHGTKCYLLFAQRLAEQGKEREAEAICRDLMQTRTDLAETNVQCAALSTLVNVLGTRSSDDLLAAMDNPNRDVRAAALELAAKMPGEEVTEEWLSEMQETSPESQAEILGMLGRRGDASAFDATLDALKSSDASLRLAAMDAAALLGGAEAVPPLLAAMQAAPDEKEIKAAQEVLLRLPSEQLIEEAGETLARMNPAPRKAVIEILAARRAVAYTDAVFAEALDRDETVRVAALKALAVLAREGDIKRLLPLLLDAASDAERSAAQESVVAAANVSPDAELRAEPILDVLASAPLDKKARVLAALPGVGGKKALDAVIAETKNADEGVKDAAARTLSDWPNADAAPELLNLARSETQEARYAVALRGYIRLVGAAPIEQRLPMYRDAMAAARRADEKKLVLAGLADVRTVESLELAAPCLDDEALKAEAALAAAKIACPQKEGDTGLADPKVVPILQKAAALIASEDQRKKVETYVASIAPPPVASGEEGFTPLFNGTDLTGWEGDTAGYVVENGIIVCKPGGNLWTAADYGDFVFRFEFKLTPGANNGLGIRMPPNTNAAYEGMEIQILDDTDAQYKDLQPYQFHGSIYGVVPAERGHLKPVGEWNDEEVTVKGRQVTVKLNGAVIVDADIDKASASGTMDGKEHPGLKRDAGRIGFLGHGTVVEFRNIRVREIK